MWKFIVVIKNPQFSDTFKVMEQATGEAIAVNLRNTLWKLSPLK